MSYYSYCTGRSGCGNTKSCCTNSTGGCGCSNNCGNYGVAGYSISGCNNNIGNCGCSNNGSCGCSNNAGIARCGCTKHHFPFPPQNSVCGTCPPGTRPCPCCYPPFFNGCGCSNNCSGCGNNEGGYAFLNTASTSVTSGSVIPFRYVIGSGDLAKGTSGGIVSLDAGCYSVEYSLSATAPTAGITITVTPEYSGALHPEYARSFTTTAAEQTFDISGAFVTNLPADTSLSLVVTTTDATDGDITVTLTDVNSSMLIRQL